MRHLRLFAVVTLLVALAGGQRVASADQPTPAPAAILANLVPAPVSVQGLAGQSFAFTATASILVAPGSSQVAAIGEYLAGILRPSTGYPLPVTPEVAGDGGDNSISMDLTGPASLGAEGYTVDVSRLEGVQLRAWTAAGLFRGIQTLRQLLPARIEAPTLQSGPWNMPGAHILDYPRFAWRGTMFDVARHFFSVTDVEHYIDLAAAYKVNVFHLHLSDDQGWRIMINSWPRLATYGGSTEVGGGPGGYYTQQQYQQIVAYAAARYITLVPEIDTPGHVNAALASYAVLNCNGIAPPLYTGTNVGFSELCVPKPVTYTFLDQVIGEIAALTPGPFFDIGGDEATKLSAKDYITFVERVKAIVQAHGKRLIGWEQVAAASLRSDSLAQYWTPSSGGGPSTDNARDAVEQGMKLVMSPANRAYLDMKYNVNTPFGQNWAGYTEVDKAYNWDPANLITGVTEANVMGVEAPVWTETLVRMADIEYMAYPRLIGIAEMGWSPQAKRGWAGYRLRLAEQGPRLILRGVNFYHSPLIPWPS